MTPHFPLSGNPNPYQPIPNPAAFTTILSTLHKHMTPHGKIPNTTTHKHPHAPYTVHHTRYTAYTVLKTAYRQPPGSHDKAIDMNFFVMPTSLTKFERGSTYMVESKISSLVLIFCFVCNSYPGCMAVRMTASVYSF